MKKHHIGDFAAYDHLICRDTLPCAGLEHWTWVLLACEWQGQRTSISSSWGVYSFLPKPGNPAVSIQLSQEGHLLWPHEVFIFGCIRFSPHVCSPLCLWIMQMSHVPLPFYRIFLLNPALCHFHHCSRRRMGAVWTARVTSSCFCILQPFDIISPISSTLHARGYVMCLHPCNYVCRSFVGGFTVLLVIERDMWCSSWMTNAMLWH